MRVRFGAGIQEVELTSVQFDLLAYFLKTPGHVISRDDMVKAVLRREIALLDRSIDVHVSNLRKNLGPAPDGGDRIRAIRGFGYIYVLPGKSKTRLIKMQRLYFKIFLWFWLAMILVSGTLIFSVVTTQQEFTASGTKQYDEILTSLVASRAADLVEDHGMGALADYLESLDTTLHWQAFLFDDEGNEILSQPTPAEANAIAQAALQTSDTKFLIAHGRKYVAKRTVGSDGTGYVFVMGSDVPSVTSILRAPLAIQIMRALVVALMAGLVCFWLARYITAPIRQLSVATHRLAAGNFGGSRGRLRHATPG